VWLVVGIIYILYPIIITIFIIHLSTQELIIKIQIHYLSIDTYIYKYYLIDLQIMNRTILMLNVIYIWMILR